MQVLQAFNHIWLRLQSCQQRNHSAHVVTGQFGELLSPELPPFPPVLCNGFCQQHKYYKYTFNQLCCHLGLGYAFSALAATHSRYRKHELLSPSPQENAV